MTTDPECLHRTLRAGPYNDAHECTTCGRAFSLRSVGHPCALCGTRGGCVYIQSHLHTGYMHESCLEPFEKIMKSAGIEGMALQVAFDDQCNKWQRRKALAPVHVDPEHYRAARVAHTTLGIVEYAGDDHRKNAWYSLLAELDAYAKEGEQ